MHNSIEAYSSIGTNTETIEDRNHYESFCGAALWLRSSFYRSHEWRSEGVVHDTSANTGEFLCEHLTWWALTWQNSLVFPRDMFEIVVRRVSWDA